MINLKPCRPKVTDHPIFGHVRAGFDLRVRVQKWTSFQTDRTMDCAFFWALFFFGCESNVPFLLCLRLQAKDKCSACTSYNVKVFSEYFFMGFINLDIDNLFLYVTSKQYNGNFLETRRKLEEDLFYTKFLMWESRNLIGLSHTKISFSFDSDLIFHSNILSLFAPFKCIRVLPSF